MTKPLTHNSIDLTVNIGKYLPTTGVYASECGGNPSFYEYKHIDSVRSMVQKQMEEWRFPGAGLREPFESFYNTIGTTFVKQITIHRIVEGLIEKHPDLVNLESSDPSVTEAIQASFDKGGLISYNLNYESLSFHEVRRIISKISAYKEAQEKLINGGQTIIDIGAGRGELGLSLLFNVYLKQLETLGLSPNTDPSDVEKHFSEHGIKPNKLVLLDSCDYIADINEAINIPLLRDALDHNQLQASISLLQDCKFPDGGFIVGHGLCGTLIDDAINTFINSNAYMLVGMPCCLPKAENETPRYNMTEKEWKQIMSTIEYGRSLYAVVDAIREFDFKRVEALAANGIKADYSYDCIDSKSVIWAMRTDN